MGRMGKVMKIALAVLMMMTIIEAQEDLQVMVNEMRIELDMMKEDMISTKEELYSQLDAKDVSIYELERSVSFLKEAPWMFTCAGHYSFTNAAGAGLNITSGQFTAGNTGSYTVTWSLRAINDAGDHSVHINMRKNGKNVDESLHYSRYTGPSGYAYDQGGRTLVVHLERGDTLDLFCNECSAGIDDVTFCVSLSHAE